MPTRMSANLGDESQPRLDTATLAFAGASGSFNWFVKCQGSRSLPHRSGQATLQHRSKAMLHRIKWIVLQRRMPTCLVKGFDSAS